MARTVAVPSFGDVIKIAKSLMLCFLQRQFHHQWQNHGTIFLQKASLKVPEALPVC
jgi:hypothetical protein